MCAQRFMSSSWKSKRRSCASMFWCVEMYLCNTSHVSSLQSESHGHGRGVMPDSDLFNMSILEQEREELSFRAEMLDEREVSALHRSHLLR